MTAFVLPGRPTLDFARDPAAGRIVFRDGALDELPAEIGRLGFSRAMVVIGRHDEALSLRVHDIMGTSAVCTWDEVSQHVPASLAAKATAHAVTAGADGIIAVGGGSAIGLGKAVAVATALPLVCVPTTYSGSEMTSIYGLTEDRRKTTRRDARAAAKLVVYDPELVASLPPEVAGPSAMNALAHCVEALWADARDPIAEAVALEGARRLHRHAQQALDDRNASSRRQVLLASYMAGTALSTAGTSVHHALCHLIGGMFDTPHGLTHAILLPYSVAFVRPSVPRAMARLAVVFGTVPDSVADTIWSLGRSVRIPQGLRAIGLTEGDIDHTVDAALARGLPSPRRLDKAGLDRMLTAAWRGLSPIP